MMYLKTAAERRMQEVLKMSKIKRVIMIEKTHIEFTKFKPVGMFNVSSDYETVKDMWKTIVEYESGERYCYLDIPPHTVAKFISKHYTTFSVVITFNNGDKTYIRKWESKE